MFIVPLLLIRAYEREVQEVHRTRAREVLGAREDESTHAKLFCNQFQNY